jgi:hypothetical protein
MQILENGLKKQQRRLDDNYQKAHAGNIVLLQVGLDIETSAMYYYQQLFRQTNNAKQSH